MTIYLIIKSRCPVEGYLDKETAYKRFVELKMESPKMYGLRVIDIADSPQQPIQEDAKKCENCGSELMTYCENCFNNRASRWRF